MNITQIAVKRPITTIMVILAMVLMGALAYMHLQVARFPAVNFPQVTIAVGFPGASAQDADQLVAIPISKAMAGVSGVTDITSTSRQGQARISLGLADNANANQVVGDVQRTLAAMAGRLPATISPPSIIKADIAAFPVMNVAISGGNASQSQLYDAATNTVAPALQQLDGVAQVNVTGGLQSQVQVQVDPAALQTYGVTLQQIQTAIGQDNINNPGGTVFQGQRNFDVRVNSAFTSLDQFNTIVVRSGPSGTVYLRDVAKVMDTFATQASIQRINGQQSVGLSITQQSDANTVSVVDAVKSQLVTLQRALPRGATFSVTNDTSRFTRQAIDAVQRDLVIAIMICAIVLLLFLHAWRNTIIVLLAIPTSMVTTFLVMKFMGFTLDTISLMALALLVGILVDDSIVVLENIHRHRKLGEEPLLAAVRGRNEIGLAAMAITLTDVVVYVPLAFISGSLGTIFREFGLTIVAATLLSLLVSFTLVPMLAAHWVTPESHGRKGRPSFLTAPFVRFGSLWDSGIDGLANFYRGVLRWSISHRVVILLLGAAAMSAAFMFYHYQLVGQEYAPQEDDSQFFLSVDMPPGTSLQATSAAMGQLEGGLQRLPEVTNVFSSVGGGFGGASTTSGNISVQLVDKGERSRSTLQVLDSARGLARAIPGMAVTGRIQSPLGGGGSPINIRMVGTDPVQLGAISDKVLKLVSGVPGTTDVQLSAPPGSPSLEAVIDRTRLAPLGISPQAVGNAVRTAVSGATVSSFNRPDGTQADVVLLLAGASTMTPAELGALPITLPAIAGGGTVRLDQVATLVPSTGPSQINRAGTSVQLSLNANVTGRPLLDVANDIQAQLKAVQIPPGYRVLMLGQVDRFHQAFNTLLGALIISVILIFMLLAALYEDLLKPLAVMFSLPLALLGAFLGLYLTGNTLNIFSMIGMIMLMGLVAKNAILLVDYTNTLRHRDNMARSEAVMEAGATRLRPILMTTATIIFAMVPLALKLESGAESRAPIAVVVIGGVISSWLLTLVVVPVVYTVLDDVPGWVRAGMRFLATRRLRPGRARVVPSPEPGAALGHSSPVPHTSGATPLPSSDLTTFQSSDQNVSRGTDDGRTGPTL